MKTSVIIKRNIVLLICLLVGLSCGKKAKESNKTAENQNEAVHEEKIALQTIFKNRSADAPKQKFKCSLDSISFLMGNKGTVIYLQPGSFVDKNGRVVKGEIDLELVEVITMEDFVKTGISTMADGQILQTGGTYFIQATKNGEVLQINPKVGVSIAVPTVEKIADMQLFYGKMVKDSLNPNGVNWKLAEGPEKDPDDMDEPQVPKEVLDPLEGLDKNEAALNLEYTRTEEFVNTIDKEYKLQGDVYVAVISAERKSSYEKSFVEKLRRKLIALKEYKKYTDQKRDFYRKKNAALYEAWERYKKLMEQYDLYVKHKPSFYEMKLREQGGQWFNIDKYLKESLVESLVKFEGKIVKNADKKPISYARVHLICEKDKVHIQNFLSKNDSGNFIFNFPKGKTFKIIVETPSLKDQVKEFTFDGSNTNLGEILI